jgi:hypothetical protein
MHHWLLIYDSEDDGVGSCRIKMAITLVKKKNDRKEQGGRLR